MRNVRRFNEERTSALWGSGGSSESGDGRHFRGGKAALVLLAALTALAAVLAVGATPAMSSGEEKATIDPSLVKTAENRPSSLLRVIVSSDAGTTDAVQAVVSQRQRGEQVVAKLSVVDGVVAYIQPDKLNQLASDPNLTVTPDQPVELTKFSSTQIWPRESTVEKLWPKGPFGSGSLPAIAIVDSGIDADRVDVAGHVVASTKVGSNNGDSDGDGNGHGTFVAGIAAGVAPGYAGAAPSAPLVSVDVMNDDGMAWTSDVIAGAQWILAHRDQYNIRVANFSLATTRTLPFCLDPLDRAVEQLWLSGVVVVAAAGNYGDGSPSGVKYAPADDPFVLTVGALDIKGTTGRGDDAIAPWSAFGYTVDGFAKPDVVAPGRYMVGPVSDEDELAKERPTSVVARGYMQLSGTSFAAPVVSGAAALVLSQHPTWTPDMVKGALMASAQAVSQAPALAAGQGQITAKSAATMVRPPNPNAGLERFLVADPQGTAIPVFDAAAWNSAAQTGAAWNSAAWNSAAWNSAAWNSAAWNSLSVDLAAWNSAAWNSASNGDGVREQAALGEVGPRGGYVLKNDGTADDN